MKRLFHTQKDVHTKGWLRFQQEERKEQLDHEDPSQEFSPIPQ